MHSALLQFNLRICVIWVFASSLIVVSAQNNTCNLQCPSGFHCFNNTVQTTEIQWGHNGHICNGQTPGECYNGEVDPLGFRRAPRQVPQTVVQGDNVRFIPENGITLEVLNVSRDAFFSCNSTNGQLVENRTGSFFQVPSKYLNPPGIKYFITEEDIFKSCSFGIRLEVYVRSRQQPGCINPAIPNLGVCSGIGLCTSQANTFFTRNYSCSCCAAYQGQYCEELDSCHASRNPRPCKNGATCHDIRDGVADSFNCSCVPGYEGAFCEKNIDECQSGPCKNGGFCVDYINEYKCLCQPETEGVNCETVIKDLCADNPCANGGTCERPSNKRGNYTCTCPPNFTGRNCTENITSSSVAVTSTPTFQTSKVFSTSLVANSSFGIEGLSTSSMLTTAVSSSTTKTSQIIAGTSSSQEMSPAVSSQQLSSVSMNTSKPVTSISPSTLHVQSPSTVRLSFSFSSVHETFVSSSLPAVQTSSHLTFSSVLLTPTAVSSTVSRDVSSLTASSGSTTVVAMTTKSMESFSARTSSLQLTSSPASSLSLSRSLSLPLKSSPALTSTVIDSASTFSVFASSTASPYVTSKSSIRTTPLSLSLSTVYYISTVKISPSMSTVLISSSVVPTTSPAPTTVPLVNQTCIDNPCNNGTCIDESYLGYKFRCECPYPTVGPVCSREFDLHFPAFGRKSFLEHKSISFNLEENRIDITFQTSTSDGLLLFAADNKDQGDFIQLRVVGGKLEFRFNPGDSLVYIQSNERVDTGETVTATATYVSNSGTPFGTLQVGNGVQLKREVSGRLIGIQLYDSWYIGGVPPGLDMLSKTKGQAAPSASFVGSIKDVQVNGETINLADAKDWYNINEGDMPACQKTPCRNDGVCIPHNDNLHGYTCNCTAGFNGMNCETHIACESESCNGGECIPKASNPLDFVCLCPFGRVGVQCQTVINITIPLFTIIQDFPSYLEYPAPRSAVNSFHVTFQFRLDNASTSWNDSLLVYSAQNEYVGSGDDFFAVGLKNNMVLLQYNLGAGSARIYSEPVNRSKEWHVVVAGRDGLDGWVYVDDQQRQEGKSDDSQVGLNLAEPLYIGGIPDPRQIPSVLEFKSGGFHGSIYDVAIRFGSKRQFIQLSTSTSVQASSKEWAVVKGRNVGDGNYDECSSRTPPCYNAGTCKREGATYLCSCPAEWAGLYCSSRRVPCYGYDNPCNSGTCRPDGQDVKCDCPLGKTGQFCDQDILIETPLFQNFSYMLFRKTYVRINTTITIKFRPLELNGILFYVARDDQSTTGDFLSIILHNGFVKLRYDLGKGVGEAMSNSTVTLNTWHTVQVDRTARSGKLIVNGGVPVRVTSPGTVMALDVGSNFYLGGVRKLSNVNPNAVDNDPAFVQDFTGCIDHFEVNGILYFQPGTGALEGRNIANCLDSISQHAA